MTHLRTVETETYRAIAWAHVHRDPAAWREAAGHCERAARAAEIANTAEIGA
jgi:hypothetical protein